MVQWGRGGVFFLNIHMNEVKRGEGGGGGKGTQEKKLKKGTDYLPPTILF